ncbi:hypothetical protein [Deinococcus cellulosilyticus]|uniref:Polyketide cyclase/dehydrase n=1 Tax=Deinococcus cellulosilyticus (strain DSM 18568 / NBRC 106333 / KACC 11606 / 5516J-15) TaxID=1223518 RepID=A0A511N7Z1_DEIC1|nr:hypothetical protein [Deinococcus cellulosilyticus]GEM48940.1 hypothetical protein DC3_45750 [Deinococcus cellulosilyticus NBRC 106333 = KACC 11606]
MHICSFSAKTSASAQTIWQLWINPKHWPRWDSTVQSAELSGPFRQGNSGTINHKDGTTSRFTILSCDMLQTIVLSFPLGMGVELLVKREWKQDGDQVMFRHELSLMGPALAKMVHASRKEALKKATLESMEQLLGLLERDPGSQDQPSGSHRTAL